MNNKPTTYEEFKAEYHNLVVQLLASQPRVNRHGVMVEPVADALADLCESVPTDWENRLDNEA